MNKRKPSAEKRVLWEVQQRYNAASPKKKKLRPAPKPQKRQPKPPAQTGFKISGKTQEPPKKRRLALKTFLVVILLAAIVSGVFGYKIISASNKISTTNRSVLGQLSDLLFSRDKVLAGEKDDRVNILLLAIGGEGHKGRNLADTIMLASIRPSDNNIALLSIPRDLYVQVPDEDYYTKINAVHAYGESQAKDNGPAVLVKKVAEITGQPIHYYGRVDFTGFKEIIDAVGGVDITIDNSFLDYWHKISFSAGTETMDGERALAFARARYVEGPEGGDFKRAARQQQLLLALRNKVFSTTTALDFAALNEIINSVSDNIRTDLELWEMKRLYEMARTIDPASVESTVLTTGHNGVLVGTTEILNNVPASVLKPKADDYSEIQAIATDLFAHATTSAEVPAAQETPEETPEPTPKPEIEKPTIEIRNGTSINGLASKMKAHLEDQGYEVIAVGNAGSQDQAETKVHALTDTALDGAGALAELLESSATVDIPDSESGTEAEALLILGPDAEDKIK